MRDLRYPLMVTVEAEAVDRWCGGVVRRVHIDDRARDHWPIGLVFGLTAEEELACVEWRLAEDEEPLFPVLSEVPAPFVFLLRDALSVAGWEGWSDERIDLDDNTRVPFVVWRPEESRRQLTDHVHIALDAKAMLASSKSRVRRLTLAHLGRRDRT